MLYIKKIIYTLSLLSLSFIFVACSSNTNAKNETTQSAIVSQKSNDIDNTDKNIDKKPLLQTNMPPENTDKDFGFTEYVYNLQYLDLLEDNLVKYEDISSQPALTEDATKLSEEAFSAWDKELNTIYSLVTKILLDEDIEKLKIAQRAWIKERDKNASEYAKNPYSVKNLGYQGAYNFSLMKDTKKRTLELIYIYFNYENDKNITNVPIKTLAFKDKSDNKTYALVAMNDSNKTVKLFAPNSNEAQLVSLKDSEIVVSIDFMDVNFDEYADIVVNTGGTVNETHDLYIWDSASKDFIKVAYRGFEMLSFFTVKDGYIENYLRGITPEDSDLEKLVWDGSTLVKEADSTYDAPTISIDFLRNYKIDNF